MKTALVTGGAKRIGAAIVRGLSAQGWRVVIHFNASKTEAESLANELKANGGAAKLLAVICPILPRLRDLFANA